MSDDPATAERTPERRANQRFPWAPAALCAASLAMAGWLWMRFSYTWTVTPQQVFATGEREMENPWAGRYVTVRGELLVYWVTGWMGGPKELQAVVGEGKPRMDLEWPVRESAVVLEMTPDIKALAPAGREGFGQIPDDRRTGRLNWQSISHGVYYAYLETTASRWYPTSIAGLVVASFVTFVFALYLRGWLRERASAASA